MRSSNLSPRLPALLCLLVYGLAGAACTSGPSAPDNSSYVREIAEARAAKDEAFRQDKDPIPADKRTTLLPLKYFDINADYSVPAVLRLADERPVFEIPTSTGQRRRYQQVGLLEFSLQGQTLTLGALVPEGEPISALFVPFADLTTGKDTYSAGRYLDLHPTQTGLYTIDFNLAYNPYCAYNATYDCPFPPPSNRLKIAVTAGERTPGV